MEGDEIKTESSSSLEEGEGEKTVPYSRFKEVNDLKNKYEADLKAASEKKDDGGLTPEQQKELQAKNYLKTLLKETLTEEERARREAEAQEQRNFEKSLQNALDENPEVEKKEFKKFLEENGDDFASIESAMKHFKRLDKEKQESYGKAKEDLKNKPRLPSHEGGKAETDYAKEDAGKSIWEIAESALRGLEKK